MKSKPERKAPQFVISDGKPSAVILEIDQYLEMLEKLEDMEDLRMLEEIRKKPLKFRRLEDFLEEHKASA